MTGRARIAAVGASLALAAGFAACGDDEESGSGGDETAAASAETATVTTGDTDDGFSWEVDPTPASDTKTIEYANESEQPHALILARINEGYTFEEAYELEGRKGSAELLAEGDAKPGDTAEIEVKKAPEPGSYALFCPIPGHYQQGQLEEFEIE